MLPALYTPAPWAPAAHRTAVTVNGCANCALFRRRSPAGLAGVPQAAHGQCTLPRPGQPKAWQPWRSETDWCDRWRAT
jgi:hypothetical protein